MLSRNRKQITSFASFATGMDRRIFDRAPLFARLRIFSSATIACDELISEEGNGDVVVGKKLVSPNVFDFLGRDRQT